MGTFISAYYIPHLGLALGIVSLGSELIVRMDLDRQVALGINELYEEREFVAGIGIYLLADKFALELLYEFGNLLAFEFAVGNDRLIALDT